MYPPFSFIPVAPAPWKTRSPWKPWLRPLTQKPLYSDRKNVSSISAVATSPPAPEAERFDQNIATDDPEIPEDAWEGLKQKIPFHALRKVSKSGQYLGNEFGAVRKPWDSVELRMCLAYPDLYVSFINRIPFAQKCVCVSNCVHIPHICSSMALACQV